MQTPGPSHQNAPSAAAPGSIAVAKALWANCIVLTAILLVMLCHDGSPVGGVSMPALTSSAYGQQMPIGGGAGVFIVPGQFSTNTWGCYLMDVDSQTLCAYQFYPGDKQLRLIAARYFKFDRRLRDFNTGTPSPDEVSQLIAREQEDARVKDQNNTPASPEEPAKNQ